jgi:tRNA A37 threonylcarbamoyladenosine dehydratase
MDDHPPTTSRLHRRHDRTARLLGLPAMAQLASSHVVIVGLGGVGSYAAEGLVRAGVGHVTLIDFDRICVTNCNRQLHALQGTTGQLKANVVAERMRLINPDATVEAIPEFYGAENAERLVPATASFVVDAIDNVKAKLHLLARCVSTEVPVVTCLGSAGRLDPTSIRVSDLYETHTDQFAKDVRKYLRTKHGIQATQQPTGIMAVWSVEPCRDPVPLPGDQEGHPCVCPHQANSPHSCDRRNQVNGSAGFVTSAFGMVAASVVVKWLTGPRSGPWYPAMPPVTQPRTRKPRIIT